MKHLRSLGIRQEVDDSSNGVTPLGPQDIVGRGRGDFVSILLTPGNHLGESFVPPDGLLPAKLVLGTRRVQPISRVLAESVICHFTEAAEIYPYRLGGAFNDLSN